MTTPTIKILVTQNSHQPRHSPQRLLGASCSTQHPIGQPPPCACSSSPAHRLSVGFTTLLRTGVRRSGCSFQQHWGLLIKKVKKISREAAGKMEEMETRGGRSQARLEDKVGGSGCGKNVEQGWAEARQETVGQCKHFLAFVLLPQVCLATVLFMCRELVLNKNQQESQEHPSRWAPLGPA